MSLTMTDYVAAGMMYFGAAMIATAMHAAAMELIVEAIWLGF